MAAPGHDVVHASPGPARLQNWQKPILTDRRFPGLFPGALRKITEEGVSSSPHDGAKLFRRIKSRCRSSTLNSDIVMIFDECTPYPATHEEAAKSMRSRCAGAAFARRAQIAWKNNALFGIVQGGMYEDLRDESLAGL